MQGLCLVLHHLCPISDIGLEWYRCLRNVSGWVSEWVNKLCKKPSLIAQSCPAISSIGGTQVINSRKRVVNDYRAESRYQPQQVDMLSGPSIFSRVSGSLLNTQIHLTKNSFLSIKSTGSQESMVRHIEGGAPSTNLRVPVSRLQNTMAIPEEYLTDAGAGEFQHEMQGLLCSST